MTTSNTELAAQKLRSALVCHPNAVPVLIEEALELLGTTDALESKAEPVARMRRIFPDESSPDFLTVQFFSDRKAGLKDGDPLYAAPVQPEKDERKPASPIECVPPKGMTSVNWRLAYRQGWADAERSHGIGSSTEGGGM